MPLINIPTKTATGNLTNVEFNQLLEALKDGTRDINTNAIIGNELTVSGDVNLDGDVVINGNRGPFAEDYTSRNVIYISKNGGIYGVDGFDGKSQGKSLYHGMEYCFNEY